MAATFFCSRRMLAAACGLHIGFVNFCANKAISTQPATGGLIPGRKNVTLPVEPSRPLREPTSRAPVFPAWDSARFLRCGTVSKCLYCGIFFMSEPHCSGCF